MATELRCIASCVCYCRCQTYRMGEQESKGCTANLETQFLFDRVGDSAGTIHLGFYTTRDVLAGQELVSQYGEEYWKTINKQLISEHKKFFEYANPYTRKLERILFKRGVPLPAHPPDLWTTPEEEMFIPKLKPYPKLDEDDHSAAVWVDAAADAEQSGAFEVERILNKRRGEDGQTWYKVRNTNSSNPAQADRSAEVASFSFSGLRVLRVVSLGEMEASQQRAQRMDPRKEHSRLRGPRRGIQRRLRGQHSTFNEVHEETSQQRDRVAEEEVNTRHARRAGRVPASGNNVNFAQASPDHSLTRHTARPSGAHRLLSGPSV